MSHEISYTHDQINGVIVVKAPYNKKFVDKARNLRGSWKKEAWVFDDSIEDYVRAALIECYGTTGEKPVEYCSLVINDYSDSASQRPVELFGRTIARAYGRDSGAKLGDGIIWIAGKYKSSGSVKNWYTEVENATFEIQNFPLPRTEFDDIQKAMAEGWCTIKMAKKKRKPEDIQADIDRYTEILKDLQEELLSAQ